MPYKGIETTDFACQSVEMTGDFFVRAVYDPILNFVPPFATLCNARQKNRWCNSIQKPHPRYLECGFMVTPTGFKPVTF